MTAAVDIAKKLRKFLNDNQYTVSDVDRALVTIINGKLGKDSLPERKPVLEATRTTKRTIE